MNTNKLRNLALSGALLMIVLFFTLLNRTFISPQNMSNLSIELAVTATLALGMLVVLLPGAIDLSVGSGVGMLGGIAAVMITAPQYLGWQTGLSAPWALLITLLIAIVIWGVMGSLIVLQHMPAFIITLGGLLIFQGWHWRIINNQTIGVAPGGTENVYSLLTTFYFPEHLSYAIFAAIALCLIVGTIKARKARMAHGLPVQDGESMFLHVFIGIQGMLLLVVVMNLYKGLPLSLVILCLVAYLIYVITQHTPFGRHLYAIGGNEEAARLSGIPVARTIITAYILMGAVVALTGFMQTAYSGYSTTTTGKLMELDAIAACVIGGTSLKGGRGNVLGVLFGALIMATLLNGMTLLAFEPDVKMATRGFVLVLAVWMDVALSRKLGK